jgi:hypothetical protein
VLSGSPTKRPPTLGPHFRAASVAAATRSGASVSRRSSIMLSAKFKQNVESATGNHSAPITVACSAAAT